MDTPIVAVPMHRHLTTLIGTGLASAAAGYACFAIFALVRGAARASAAALRIRTDAGCRRPVSILKPLCGDEPGLYGNLRSFCTQSYPVFQVLFGVRDPRDAAVPVVRRLQAEFPEVDIQLVIDPRVHGTNLKVSNLLNILPEARYDWLVLADSDIGVSSDYLGLVTRHLSDPDVGVVTCLYRSVPRSGLWSRLGAMFIDDWFAPSVRVSHALGSTRFAFGATIALRRQTLQAAGGFEALSDLLADDFWLGEFTRRMGMRTVLSNVVVTTDVTEGSLSALWEHELRWLRTIRSSEPVGFAFSFVTFTIPMLAVGLMLARTEVCATIAAIGAVARIVLHYLQRQRRIGRPVMLLAVRETLLLAEWAAAHVGSRVRWRDQVLDASVGRTATAAVLHASAGTSPSRSLATLNPAMPLARLPR
ncbi:MAG: bacteriohopanetetrol glucosamine biosynthesis glycosyltransferase HpnI [Opitutaceae bacterium]